MPLTFTAEQAAKVIAKEAGFDWQIACDRQKALDALNGIREHLWSFKFVKGWPIDECETVEKFLEDCACAATYLGIALPVSATTAVSMQLERGGSPMPIVARGGIDRMNRPADSPSCEVKAIQMGSFSLRHDPPADDTYFYWFKSTSSADNNKTVRVCYINAAGNHTEEDVVLVADGNRTTHPVMRLMTPNEFGGITLPDDMVGTLRIGCYKGDDGGKDGDGPYHSLADIPPGITAPSWMRYKLQGVCCGSRIRVVGKHDFIPITCFLSWVESNKGELWKAGYRYVRGINQQSVDEQMLAANAQNLATFQRFVLAEQEAFYGTTKTRSIRFEGFLSPYAPSRMYGTRR